MAGSTGKQKQQQHPLERGNLKLEKLVKERGIKGGVLAAPKRRMSVADQIIQSYPAPERLRVQAMERLMKMQGTLEYMREIRRALAERAL